MAWRICRAQNDFAKPGHGEQDTAITCVGNDQCLIARKKLPVNHNMNTLAGRDD